MSATEGDPRSDTVGRNLVVCCDGTANEFERDRTNVLKLSLALIKDPDRQLLYYHPGIGTRAPAGVVSRTGAFLARLAGKAFGYGLKADIADAYTFIMNEYRPGDRLYLFGFSRGAYTVRAVTALLHLYGLIGRGNEALVPYAVRLLWSINRARGDDKKVEEYFALAREFKQTLRDRACKPHFLGIWDTVSSVGWIGTPVALPYTKDLPDVEIVRHAVAIDERRAFFRTNLIARDAERDFLEVWFPGVHCDVGGGYLERDSGLSKISLQWMLSEARKSGLRFDEDVVERVSGRRGGGYVEPNPRAPLHNSLTWNWWPAEFLPKRYFDRKRRRETWRMSLFRRRTFGPAPYVHDSAWQVGGNYEERLPADARRLSDIGSPLAS